MNKEKEFIWTDELVQKFAEEYRFSSSRTSLEQFVKCEMDKLKEEEKPIVVSVNLKSNTVDFIINTEKEYYHITKERLAEILIAESKGDITIWRIKDDNICPATNKQCDDECCPTGAICNLKPSVWGENPKNDVEPKLYTEKEWLQFGEECFNAATMCLLDHKEPSYRKRYESFSDYMNDLKK